MLEVITSTATIINPQITGAVNDMLTVGLKAALIGVTALLSWGIKVGVSSIKSSWKRAIAQRLVAYASKKLTDNESKRQYVAHQLHVQFPRISEEEANHLLEEAVVNLQTSLAAPVIVKDV
jgi:hypothetical protein